MGGSFSQHACNEKAQKRVSIKYLFQFCSTSFCLLFSVFPYRNSKGTQLFLCSTDGTVAFVEFNKNEIGIPLTEEEKVDLHNRISVIDCDVGESLLYLSYLQVVVRKCLSSGM